MYAAQFHFHSQVLLYFATSLHDFVYFGLPPFSLIFPFTSSISALVGVNYIVNFFINAADLRC